MTDIHDCLYREIYDKVRLLSCHNTIVSNGIVINSSKTPLRYEILGPDAYYLLTPNILRDISYGEGSDSTLIYNGYRGRAYSSRVTEILRKLLDMLLIFPYHMRVSTK